MDLLRQYLKVEIQFQNGEDQQQHTALLVSKVIVVTCCHMQD